MYRQEGNKQRKQNKKSQFKSLKKPHFFYFKQMSSLYAVILHQAFSFIIEINSEFSELFQCSNLTLYNKEMFNFICCLHICGKRLQRCNILLKMYRPILIQSSLLLSDCCIYQGYVCYCC